MNRMFLCSVSLSVGLLAACGPQLKRPEMAQHLVEREREQQREMALRLFLERAEQVNRVAGLLKVQAKESCENHLEPQLGAFWIGLDSFPYDDKDVATRIFGLEEESLRVHSVIAGQPAAAAGIRHGDAILKIGETPISSYKSWYSLTKAQHAQNLVRDLGKNPIDLELRRGSDILSLRLDPISACRYRVDLVANDRVNAFTNGDSISITTGMLRFIRSDDELALIIGHEIAHNTLNHVGRTRGIGTMGAAAGILLDIGMAAAGVYTGGALTQAGHNFSRLVFSKEFEMESDYLGLYLAARAGFDISKAPDFFRRMAVEYSGSISENFLSSHPSTPERAVAMEGVVQEIRAKVQASEPLTPRRIEP